MKILVALLYVVLAMPALTFADDLMTKVVIRQEASGLDPNSFAAKPKTIYRWQATKGRVEQAVDADHHIQQLFIADGKDAWFIDQLTKTGKHMVDPSTDHNFYAPIVPPESPNSPAPVRSFEIGRELDFMVNQKVTPKPVEQNGKSLSLYECVQEGYTLDLYVLPNGIPVESDVLKDGKQLLRLIYLEYSSLPADPALFKAPDGVQISEG